MRAASRETGSSTAQDKGTGALPAGPPGFSASREKELRREEERTSGKLNEEKQAECTPGGPGGLVRKDLFLFYKALQAPLHSFVSISP